MFSIRSLPLQILLFFRHATVGTIFLCLIFDSIFVFGQNTESYHRVVSQGKIPNDFLISAREKFSQVKAQSEKETTQDLSEEQKLFYEGSAFYINQLLKSGKVLFNDPISKYVGEVGKYLLRKHPELKKKTRFYVVKSAAVNAFATNSGIILVNMGLIARLENEAQLAFILAHEISHFARRHPLEIFLQSRAVAQSNNSFFKPTNLEEVLLAQNNYTKEKELEADQEGWELYKQTAYDLNSVLDVFDILKNADLPISRKSVDIQFFENNYFTIPSTYIPPLETGQSNQLGPKTSVPNTHPAPEERQARLAIQLQQLDSDKIRHLYILGKDQFETIKNICRQECSFLHLLNQKYEAAIYDAHLNRDINPNLPFREKIKLHALYALSKYMTAGKFWDIHKSHEEQKGAYKQIAYLLEKLSPLEMNVLAITHHWQVYGQNTQDEEIFLQLEDLIVEFQKFYAQKYEIIDGTQFIQKQTSFSEESKIEFTYQALLKLFKEVQFRTFYSQVYAKVLADTVSLQGKNSSSPALSTRQNINRLRNPKGFHLGLERAIFVEPFYERIDSRSGQNEYLEQEAKEETYTQLIDQYADQLDLSHQILSKDHLNKSQVDIFNDLSLLDEWITEKIQYGDIDMVSINHNEIRYLTEKYDAKYFVWTGSLALTRQRSGKILVASAGFLLPILLPYSIYYATTPSHHTWYYTIIFDLEKEEYVLEYPRLIRMKDKPDIVNAIVYDLIYQMKSHP